jgi:tetratricopeptide (TPR) repeat protein
MFFIVLITIILVVSLALLLFIVFRHLPELKVLDIESIPKERQVEAKIKILEAKFLRRHQVNQDKLSKAVGPVKEKVSNWLKKAQENVKVMEKKYQRETEVEETRTKSINELFAEAKALISSQNYPLAEKNLIEIIARDKKDIRAYEMLAELYRLSKSYDQAEEVIKYLIKLRSLKFRKNKNAEIKKEKIEDTEAELLETIDLDNELGRYYDDLAKVYELADKKDKALDCYLRANAIEPNNPKFLDKVVELAIIVGDKGLASKTYRRLKEINPENGKLADFKEVLEKMK